MLTGAKFKQHCTQLVDPSLTSEARKDLAIEVRDSIELVHSHEYTSFLANFLPAFKVVLSVLTKPQQVDNIVHQTRAVILEVLNRLPHNDVLRTKFLDVFSLAMEILQTDNEENAITAIHIIFDLHKNYRHHLEGQVQPFLDFVCHLYESFPTTVKVLLTKKPPEVQGQPTPRRMAISSQSFKVVTECPLLVMFVFQLYPSFTKNNIQRLLPLMLRAIEVEIPPHAVAAAPKTVFQEFVAAQVKTVSFLAYLLKQFPELMKADGMSIPRSVVKLLQSCPVESVLIRRELLVATRHILGSPFRQGFFGQIDLLLEPRILVGTGRGAADTLRPLAYSFLAELVHCVRLNLSISQLEKIIAIFSTNLHDPTFSYSLQTSAVRLLLNLIEGILSGDNDDSSRNAAARKLLLRILETMVAKYVTLGAQVPRLLNSMEELRLRPDPIELGQRLCEVSIGDPMKEIADFKTLLKTLTLGLKTLIWSAINVRVSSPNVTKTPSVPAVASNNADISATTQGNVTPGRPGVRAGLLEKECEIVAQLLGAGQKCFRLYSQLEERNRPSSDVQGASNTRDSATKQEIGGHLTRSAELESEFSFLGPTPRIVVASPQEEREMFDQFAQIFTVLDIRSFQDVFGLRMGDLFDHIVENPAALMIPQHFLANSNISKYFADILLNFLVDNLSIFDVALPRSASVLSREEKIAQSFLKLFKILFASVTLFPTNEPVLRMHIGSIVRRCLQYAAKAKDPHNYLQMLRALFKTLTNNKSEIQFELLYRDFMPLVEPLFSGLLSLYQGPNRLLHSELIVELCLMIPARPSTIFPYLDLQIKPIVWALEGGRDNVQYGLRTLEFWVDMLQPGYLERLLGRVEPGLSQALYRLLRPPQTGAFGATTLRILGKLGSRARCNGALSLPFETRPESHPAQQVSLTWPDGSDVMVETDTLIRLSADALLNRRVVGLGQATAEHKAQAWKFLYVCLCPFLGILGNSDALPSRSDVITGVWSLSNVRNAATTARMSRDNKSNKAKHMREAEAALIKTMLVALIGSIGLVGIEGAFADDSGTFGGSGKPELCITDMSRYFALLTVQSSEQEARGARSKPSLTSPEAQNARGFGVLSHTLFLDAIITVLSLEDRALCRGGLTCLQAYISGVVDCCVTTKLDVSRGPGDGKEMPEMISAETRGEKTFESTSNKMEELKKEAPATALPKPPSDISDHRGSGSKEAVSVKEGESASLGQSIEQGDVKMTDVAPERAQEKKIAVGDVRNLKDEYMLAASLAAVVDRLCHCCYQRNWNTKWAGANGLGVVVDKIGSEMFRSPAFATNIIHIVRALLFVIRDSSGAIEHEIVEHGRTILHKLLRICFARREPGNATQKSLPSELSNVLRETTVRLTVDLACDSVNARETARQCLRTLGETLKCEVADMLTADPCKEQLLRPLMQRSIRQQPFPVQIGYIEAIIFCLQLERPLFSKDLFSPPLRNLFLNEVIAVSEDPTIEKLTEAEEGIRNKLVENRLIQIAVVKHLVLLRKKALELLCNVAIQCSSFLKEARNDELFRRMVSSLFKNLQSRDAAIVDSAKRGLKQAISKHPKPKDLLQQNLRPILSNLADYKKLTMHYVQGLSRVLELFAHWFNVNLGEKLLEHLQRWTEPEKLAHLKRLAPGTEARVGAAILDLFHHLPQTASMFLENIVLMVIRLESVLAVAGPGVAHLGLKSAKAASTSPYREPLLKYCNRNACVAAKFFLVHLDKESRRQLFFVMIRSTESQELRKELMDNPKRLVSPTYLSVEGLGTNSLHIITVIDLLSRHDAGWLGRDPDLMTKLFSYWKTASSFSEVNQHSFSSLGRVQEVKTLSEIFIRYCSHFPKEISTLFELLPVFSTRIACDFTFVKEFLKRSVTKSGLFSSRRAVIVQFLSLFQDKTISQERKVHALQHIVTPMLESHLEERKKQQDEAASAAKSEYSDDRDGNDAFHAANAEDLPEQSERKMPSHAGGTAGVIPAQSAIKGEIAKTGVSDRPASFSGKHRMVVSSEHTDLKDGLSPILPDSVLDATIIQRIMKELLDQPDEILRNYDEPLSAELLRLATILIRYMPTELGRFRKELIKFGWNHLKREDSIAKQRAFVNVSRFFEAYQAPGKIILQVFVALLRACQPDGRELVQEALDILTPALPRRLEHKPTDHKYPIWIRYTKKILLEEGHSTPNLVHIWQLIARHASLFYVARAQFVPIMVNSLNRIGLNASASSENRRLALDLVDLIIKWERTRRANHDSDISRKGDETNESGPQPVVRKRTREEESGTIGTVNDSSKADASQAREAVNEPPAKTRKSIDSQPIPVSSSPGRTSPLAGNRDAEDFKPTSAMTDVLVQFLVQIPFRAMDRREGPLVTKRSIVLLKEASYLWPDSTARLTFVEKLLAPPGQDKVGSLPQQNQGSKDTTNQGSQDLPNAGGKNGSKGDTLRSEKAEHVRLKRSAARYAALTTALGMTCVLAKCQGRKFVEENVLAIRALILPAITESRVQTCVQFSALLKELIRVCPFPSLGNLEIESSKETPKSSKAHATKTEPPTQKGHGPGSERRVVAQSDLPSKIAKRSENVGKHIYKVVHEAIEVSLKTPDPLRNQCGLVVLQVFSKSAPEEFVKYQEILAKSLHRMTKENLNSSQQSAVLAVNSSTGGGGGGGNRVGSATDRSIASAPVLTPARTSMVNDTGIIQDASARVGKSLGAEEASSKKISETQALILCISILGDNIMTLEPGQRKTLFHLLWALIDRCLQVEILLEIVRVVRSWVMWKPRKEKLSVTQKEPLTSKEKVHFLIKMVVFERIVGKGSQELMKAYLDVILKIFGGDERRPELLPRLERAFMLGMKATESHTRQQFFRIYNDSIARSLPMRVAFVLAKQEWEPLADQLWIKHATEVLIAAADHRKALRSYNDTVFATAVHETTESFAEEASVVDKLLNGPSRKVRIDQSEIFADPSVLRFCRLQRSVNAGSFVAPLQALLHHDSDFACHTWVELFPKAWAVLSPSERASLERSIPPLLGKEHHQVQSSWPRNNIQALLEAFVRCDPLPSIRADLIFHLGSQWNAWHTALYYLEAQEVGLKRKLKSGSPDSDENLRNKIRAEFEDNAEARAELYRLLHERDFLAGSWKLRAKSPLTKKALTFEQLAKYSQAQNVYGSALAKRLSSGDNGLNVKDDGKSAGSDRPGKTEACYWEERWIDCARRLCQWEVLTEFARVVVNSELLHECLWRVPDWSALKELLIKNPVEDGPQLKLYQAYVHLQENKLDVADSFIMQGYQRALERYCALPASGDLDAYGPILVQFQQLVELQESGRILGELNALSRHGSGSINVEQKIDNVRLILNTWRERLPSQHEALTVWNDVLTWRNHVHAVVVNVLDALKEAASAKVAAAQGSSNGGSTANRNHGNGLNAQTQQVQAAAAIAQALPQQVLVMGVNETAWNVHRFAKACRKQGFPEMALYALQKLYPFGTMELTEYFVKTKETARSFMANPLGVENGTEHGLHELNRCNMDHFNARQKAQLFTVRGKLCAVLGREDEAVDAFTVALSTSSDVGSAWLAWGLHCDMLQERFSKISPLAHTADAVQREELDADPSQIEFETALEWREAAVNCYLQGVRFGSRKSRLYLPRVLRLLTADVQARLRVQTRSSNNIPSKNSSLTQSGSLHTKAEKMHEKASATTVGIVEAQGSGSNQRSTGSLPGQSRTRTVLNQPSLNDGVARIVTGLVPELPSWMWLPWLPQIVLMLCRNEGIVIRPILIRIAQQYPQAVFFPIRAFMEDRKPIDRPEKILSKEALKMGRPITSALLPNTSSVQGNANRQAQTAKENVHRAQQHYVSIQKGLQRTEAAIAASPGTADQSAQIARKVQLKEDLMNARRLLEKCMRDYKAAEQRNRQLLERPSLGHGTGSVAEQPMSRKQVDTPSKLQAGAVKSEAMQVSGGTESIGENKGDGASAKHEASGASTGRKNASSGPPSSDPGQGMGGGSVHGTPFGHADYVMAHIVKSHQLFYLEVERIALELSFRLKPQREEHLLSLMNALLHRCYQYPVKMGKEVAPSFRSALEEVSRMCFGTGLDSREKHGEQNVQAGIADLKDAFEAELAPQTSNNFPSEIEPFIARLRRWQGIFQRRVEAMPECLKLESMSRHLMETNKSDVEVFGQYVDVDISEPDNERHVKIEWFSADVRLIRRHSGPSRGIRIMGSDGKTYDFVLEASINASIQSTEDRTAQIYRLLNSAIFAKDSEAHRRRIQLTVPTFVVTGARSRLVSDDPSLSSLVEGLEQYLESHKKTFDDPLMAFRTLASEAYSRRRVSRAKETSRAESIAARVDAYHSVCDSHVPDYCFSDWVVKDAKCNELLQLPQTICRDVGCNLSGFLFLSDRGKKATKYHVLMVFRVDL